LAAAGPAAAVTDDDVGFAIQRGREYLWSIQRPDGSFGPRAVADARFPQLITSAYGNGGSALAFMTLAYLGEHPNRPEMAKAIAYIGDLDPDRGFGGYVGYALPIRIMGLCYVHDKLADKRREAVRAVIARDLARIVRAQQGQGGWRYGLDPSETYDFSITQWVVLAIREAREIGLEVPPRTLDRALQLYRRKQGADGGWAYADALTYTPYLSMTAAGLASLSILSDALEPASGCPCGAGQGRAGAPDTNRRLDAALEWVLAEYRRRAQGPALPREPAFQRGWGMYEMYCVERVGIAAGYKYLGPLDWYKDGADRLVQGQRADGSWGSLTDTCFALLFLHKGRAPVLFNKVRFAGLWNPHRRDVANLTRYIERTKEQAFHWQIVDLSAPLEELKDAPILYVSAESVPDWDEAQARKLRAFTDQGGTILFEAACGSAAVRRWFDRLARALWPEWPLAALPADHGLWKAVYPMDAKKRPDILGVDDGLRTAVFFSPDDISCPWHAHAVAGREYLFQWGINLYTYATDGAPLRAKLAGRGPRPAEKYARPVEPGTRTALRMARVVHGGDWDAGRHYLPLAGLAAALAGRTAVRLLPGDDLSLPGLKGGRPPKHLKGFDLAFLTGTRAPALAPDEQAALKEFVSGGGFLWLEAAGGSAEFGRAAPQLAADLGWTVRPLATDHAIVTGRMPAASGYDLASGVRFSRALKIARAGRTAADLGGLFDGNKLVGIFSPLDICFSATGYQAYDLRGYEAEDARAVAANILLYVSQRGDPPKPAAAEPPPGPPPQEPPAPPGEEVLPWKRAPAAEP
jgi:hypothetical protein